MKSSNAIRVLPVGLIISGLLLAGPGTAWGHSQSMAVNQEHLRPWSVRLCFPPRATPHQKATQVRIIKRRLKAEGITRSEVFLRNGCTFVQLQRPFSRLRALVTGLRAPGRLALAVDVPPKTSSSSTAPMAGQRVRYADDPITKANRNYPKVRIAVPSVDIERGSAMITFDSNKLPLLTYSMNTAGTEAWCRFTTSHVNDSSPVVLDRQVVVDPTIESAICGGQTQVSGMSLTAARELAVDINVGSLPVGWRLVRSRGA